MYHGVAPDRPDWIWNHLIIPIEVFEGQMRAIADEGWTAIGMGDLYSHMSEGAPLPQKPLVITFDDGYLDNWVYAFPILKKYGHRGLIWLSTDFVDPHPEPRPTLEDVWSGRLTGDELVSAGYLSWEEMRQMVSSGHIEIQSHAKTHTWYFSGPEIADFHRPVGADGYVPPAWLAWNRAPEVKYKSMTADLERGIPYGTPVYRHGLSLVTRRYFEDPGITNLLVEMVAAKGGDAFFRRAGWREVLTKAVDEYPSRNDRIETQAEYEQRVRGELADSRRTIEEALGTKVDFLCWPGGGHSPLTRRIASEVGYLATTTHFDDAAKRNVFGENPHELNRILGGSPWIWRQKVTIRHTDPEFLLASLERFAGDSKKIWWMRGLKLKYLLRYYLTGID
jgi:peptidoglycan/xylan/chitin deacetylase (PgdA/CDA1 family)